MRNIKTALRQTPGMVLVILALQSPQKLESGIFHFVTSRFLSAFAMNGIFLAARVAMKTQYFFAQLLADIEWPAQIRHRVAPKIDADQATPPSP
ncbi:MAG: hypothetical protein IPN53_16810 [Comamonadaceae bacterium]|nr:hypothetical protein [Comamonadaceae bacterium]